MQINLGRRFGGGTATEGGRRFIMAPIYDRNYAVNFGVRASERDRSARSQRKSEATDDDEEAGRARFLSPQSKRRRERMIMGAPMS